MLYDSIQARLLCFMIPFKLGFMLYFSLYILVRHIFSLLDNDLWIGRNVAFLTFLLFYNVL